MKRIKKLRPSLALANLSLRNSLRGKLLLAFLLVSVLDRKSVV